MNRPLGATESIYYLLDHLYCLNFVVYAELDGVLDPAALDRALQIVQSEQPLLRARIAPSGRGPSFKDFPMDQAPLKVQVGPFKDWRRNIEGQLDTPFGDNAPLARFFLFGSAGKKSVAAMVFHHSIADGRSGTCLFLEVLRRASGEQLPLEYQAAHPSAQALDLVMQEGVLGGSVKKLKYWWSQGKAAWMLPSQLPRYDTRLRPQRKIKAISIRVPQATSQALLAACREHGTSVHGALGAAQVLALHDEFDNRVARNLALTSLADLRGVLSAPLTERDLGLYIATITTVHAVAAEPDFWQLAAQIRQQLQEVLHSGDANLVHSMYREDSLLPPGKNAALFVQAAVSLAPKSSMLTNIGRVDNVALDNGTAIRALAFLVSPPPQHPICVTATTYADYMHLNLLYDQTKLEDTQATRIAKSIMASIHAAANNKGR